MKDLSQTVAFRVNRSHSFVTGRAEIFTYYMLMLAVFDRHVELRRGIPRL